MSLCKHQNVSNEPCANGLSRRMTCGLGFENTCVRQCQPETCADFVAPERPKPSPNIVSKAVRGGGMQVQGSGTGNGSGNVQSSGCGGCGKNSNNGYHEGRNVSYG